MEKVKQWYIVYTKLGQEQKVCEALRRKKLESFFPVSKTTKLSSGKEKITYKPLFERYVFVCVSDEETSIVKNTGGIINFLHWIAEPLTLQLDDIYLLKRFFKMHEEIALEKIKVNIAQSASISNYSSDDGSEDIIHFNFPALGFKMIAKESKTRVKVLTVPTYQTKTNLTKQYAETR